MTLEVRRGEGRSEIQNKTVRPKVEGIYTGPPWCLGKGDYDTSKRVGRYSCGHSGFNYRSLKRRSTDNL